MKILNKEFFKEETYNNDIIRATLANQAIIMFTFIFGIAGIELIISKVYSIGIIMVIANIIITERYISDFASDMKLIISKAKEKFNMYSVIPCVFTSMIISTCGIAFLINFRIKENKSYSQLFEIWISGQSNKMLEYSGMPVYLLFMGLGSMVIGLITVSLIMGNKKILK